MPTGKPSRLPSVLSAAAAIFAASLALAVFSACRQGPVLEAERPAPVGSEFIRLFPDGHAEYGYGVVKENLKAQGGYRYAYDTV